VALGGPLGGQPLGELGVNVVAVAIAENISVVESDDGSIIASFNASDAIAISDDESLVLFANVAVAESPSITDSDGYEPATVTDVAAIADGNVVSLLIAKALADVLEAADAPSALTLRSDSKHIVVLEPRDVTVIVE
jgi:hypothetical protein